MKNSILRDKSYAFAVAIIKLVQSIQSRKKEFVLSKQILRSGTAIGALLREGQYAQSTRDFINKFKIALKEANETEYWLLLLNDTGYLPQETFEEHSSKCKELIAMLISSINTLRAKNKKMRVARITKA